VIALNSKPLVTVIIPCYNHAKYISQCIESILKQTYTNIELIIVDNGSTDDSYNRIVKYAKLDGVRIIRLDNNIPPGKINGPLSIALKVASGEYISLLYSDDWYKPDKIEKQILCFLQAPPSVGVVYCHGYRYFESTGSMLKWSVGFERGYVFDYYLNKGDLVIPISPLVKKYCYEIIGTDNLWTGSEYDFFSMSQFVDFDYIDDYLVVMRDHDSNDGKNVLDVYNRVCLYNEEFFSSKSTLSRAGKLVSIRLSKIYLIFARDFAEIGDRKMSKVAFLKALSTRAFCLCSVRGLIIVIYLLLPHRLYCYVMKLCRAIRSIMRNFGARIVR